MLPNLPEPKKKKDWIPKRNSPRKRKIESFEKSDYDVLFVKLREPEEIKRLALLYDVKTVLIKRKDHKIIT